jgi:hypothetical protein
VSCTLFGGLAKKKFVLIEVLVYISNTLTLNWTHVSFSGDLGRARVATIAKEKNNKCFYGHFGLEARFVIMLEKFQHL